MKCFVKLAALLLSAAVSATAYSQSTFGTLTGAVTDSRGASNVINSETPTVTDSKSGREIASLALNFRATNNPSPIVVATLAPGVQQDRGGNVSVAGGQPYTTSFSLDGVSTQS